MNQKSARILICARSAADAESVLRLAPLLGREAFSQLAGLLAEDLSDLLDCSTPGGVVTTTGEIVAPPDPVRLTHVMAGERRAFETALARMAQTLSADWTFERYPEPPERAVRGQSERWDILLLGVRKLRRGSAPVFVLSDYIHRASAALELGERLAKGLGVEPRLITTGQELPEKTSENTVRVRFPEAIGHLDASALVIDLGSGPIRSMAEAFRLYERAHCPLVILPGDEPADDG